MRSIAVGLLILSAIFIGLVQYRQELGDYQKYLASAGIKTDQSSEIRVTFLGTTSLLFSDGETSWMTDGFFSRPGILKVLFGQISPDRAIVERTLKQAGVHQLAAVIPLHSHYDHALDSPLVAELTKARLIGSLSTAQIGAGFGLPQEQIQIVKKNGEQIVLGKFKITFLNSQHSPKAYYPGEITEAVTVPVKAEAFKMGDCYNLLVEHEGQKFLISGSAGFEPGALQGRQADVVFLSIGMLGKQPGSFREQYWKEVVQTVRAKRVVLLHWDDFFRPLSENLVPAPWWFDNFDQSMDDVIKRSEADRIEILIPRAFEKLAI